MVTATPKKPKPAAKPGSKGKAKPETPAASAGGSQGTPEKRLLPEQILALNRITSDKLIKAARSEVKDGRTYEVDFGVRVVGKLSVGLPSACKYNNVPESADLVQALLAQFGPRKRQQIVNELITAGVARTIAPNDEPIAELPELAARLINGLTTTTSGNRRGNVTGDVDVTLIEWT